VISNTVVVKGRQMGFITSSWTLFRSWMQTGASDACCSCLEVCLSYSCVLINTPRDIWLFPSVSHALGGCLFFNCDAVHSPNFGMNLWTLPFCTLG